MLVFSLTNSVFGGIVGLRPESSCLAPGVTVLVQEFGESCVISCFVLIVRHGGKCLGPTAL